MSRCQTARQIQGRDLVNSVESLTSALNQQITPTVIEADKVFFRLFPFRDIQNCPEVRNLSMEFSQPVQALTTRKHQRDRDIFHHIGLNKNELPFVFISGSVDSR